MLKQFHVFPNLDLILFFEKSSHQNWNKLCINNSLSTWTHVYTHLYGLVSIPSGLIDVVIKL